MEKIGGVAEVRSANCGVKIEDIAMESLQFGEEIQRLMSVPPPPPADTGSSFTALLGLPATQAMELLHSSEQEETPGKITGDTWSGHPQIEPTKPYPIFPSNAALIDRASKFSVFAAGDVSPVTSSVPSNSSANSHKVKPEPMETDSNPNSSPAVSDSDPNKNPKSTKRKEREKKGKTTNKKSKSMNETSEDGEKLPYVHVRARRGQATDSHSLAERARREKINERMKLLQELVPGCNKISGTAMVLDEIINHVQSLQRQVELLSMRLAAVNPRTDFNLDNLFAAEIGPLTDISLPSVVMPSTWPEGQVNGNRQQYQQQLWHLDGFQQAVWGREEDHPNFITPENSLLSYDSLANSASLHENQLKMEL